MRYDYDDLSVPLSSGKWLQLNPQNLKSTDVKLTFSPLVIGEMAATKRTVAVGATDAEPFSPLVIGEMAATAWCSARNS